VFHLHIKHHDMFQEAFITIGKILENRNLLGFVGIFCNKTPKWRRILCNSLVSTSLG
jgi:hypothetical protein